MKNNHCSIDNNNELYLGKYSWTQIIKWLMAALVVYAIGSVFIATPFSIFVDRTTPVDYSRVMYFHGLTVSLAGIVCLSLSQVYNLRNQFKKIIFYCTIVAIFVGITGGAINRSMETTKLMLWYQIISFLALDVIFITLLIGLIKTDNQQLKKSLAYYLVVTATTTVLIAALIGDLIGFILDFGDVLGLFSWYAGKIGYSLSEWNDNLLRSHSDMIVVSVMGLILSTIDWKYGQFLNGKFAILKATGEWMAIIGLILMTLILVISGFCGVNWQIPHIFTEKGFFALRGQSVAGIDLVDFIIGTLFFFGGLFIIASTLFGNRAQNTNLSHTAKYTLVGILLTWSCIIITVAGMGFLQEYRADLYNSAKDVPLADYGFAFRMLHLDVSLILFPAIMTVMLFVQHLLKDNQNRFMQFILRVAVILCTIGSLVYMVLNPAAFGPGYWIVGIGFVFIITAMIYFFVNGSHSALEKFDAETIK
ncbi:hypothetical protein [Gallibacterium salpingitidis]|uniref:Uncharacterized protein n=1 Tax=Gallibacterium salpingitidis TaxID=505341 RepID=A0A1A7NNM4_9PAST|nr:hypothetical protein [Gallibacterium salpingitidis]OBW91757.1 hypothetical protein QS62_10160 [Gallibacterium salpingitidis]